LYFDIALIQTGFNKIKVASDCTLLLIEFVAEELGPYQAYVMGIEMCSLAFYR
jgi:hypothetical protein